MEKATTLRGDFEVMVWMMAILRLSGYAITRDTPSDEIAE